MNKPDYIKAAAYFKAASDFAAAAARRRERIDKVIELRDELQARVNAREDLNKEFVDFVLKFADLIEQLRDIINAPFPDEHETDRLLDAIEEHLKFLE